MNKRLLIFSLPIIFLMGCTSKQFVTREEYEIFSSSLRRNQDRYNREAEINRGATQENRQAIDVLQEQLEEVSRRLGIIKENIAKSGELETKFNGKLKHLMTEVVKENERVISQINKVTNTSTNSNNATERVERQSGAVNIYEETDTSPENLDTGYYHVVEPGESISKIAHRYQVPIEYIVKANDLGDPDALYVGQKLFIPDPGES